MSEIPKIYTAKEVAGLLRVGYKATLDLIKRGQLKALPGIRHKRITEAALNCYLSASNTLVAGAGTPATTPLPVHPRQRMGITNNAETKRK